MGVWDIVRGVFASQCQRLTKCYSRTFEFTGLGAEVLNAKVSLAGIKTSVTKIDEAGKLVILLDVYQWMICLATRDLDRPKREKYIKLRIGAIGLITSLHGTLVAFASDPEGQKRRLDEAVRVMQDFMGRVGEHSLQFMGPRRIRKRKGKRILIRESIEPLLKAEEEAGIPQIDKHVAPIRGKGARGLHPRTLAALVRAKALSDAFEFAGLEKSKVNQLAKELAKGHHT